MSRLTLAMLCFLLFVCGERPSAAQPAPEEPPPSAHCAAEDHPCVEQSVEEPPEASEPSPPASVLDDVQFSGQLFMRYGWNTTGTEAEKNFNSFALDRWYFTAKATLSEHLKFRGTTDVISTDDEAGLGYTLIVKYAYFDWQMQPWLNLRAGVHQTGWENYVTSVWGYRGVAKTMAHEQGHLSTSDLGATLSAELPQEWGMVAAGVHNGGGYRRLESDRFKDISARLVLTSFAKQKGVLAPVRVGSHVYQGQYSDGRPRFRWGGLLAYEGAAHTLALNYELRKDGDVRGSGVSVFGERGLGAVQGVGAFSLIGLLDVYGPHGATGADRQIRSVTGLAYQPVSGLTLSLNYQQVRGQTAAFDRYDGTTSRTDGRVLLNAIVKY